MISRRRQKTEKGSLTVFAAVSFMLIAGLLFTLAEGVRQTEMNRITEMNTDAAAESLLARYCIPLWEQYQLLGYEAAGSGVDTGEMEQEIIGLTNTNFAVDGSMVFFGGTSLLRPVIEEAEVTGYTLMTDSQGAVFVKQAADYMNQNLSYEGIKLAYKDAVDIYNNFLSSESLKESSSFDKSNISSALSVLSSKTTPQPAESAGCKSKDKTKKTGLRAQKSGSESGAEAVLQKAENSAGRGILSQVLSSDAEVSFLSIEKSGTVSGRTLFTGTSEDTSVSFKESILAEMYFLTRFSCYTDDEDSEVLSYELEYLIGGQESDSANLKTVVAELLGIREAANFAYLAGSASKRAELKAFAETVTAVTANPLVGGVVTAGLMAGWAYAESLMDVRALLAGKKIPLIKSDATWTSSLENLSSILDGSGQAKESSTGINYRTYLGILLFMVNISKKGMRAMDLIEQKVRLEEGYQDFRMDQVIVEADITARYSWQSLFFAFVPQLAIKDMSFVSVRHTKMSYTKNTGT